MSEQMACPRSRWEAEGVTDAESCFNVENPASQDQHRESLPADTNDQAGDCTDAPQTCISGLKEPSIHMTVTNVMEVVMQQTIELERTQDETTLATQTIKQQINTERRELEQVQSQQRQQNCAKEETGITRVTVTNAVCDLSNQMCRSESEISRQQLSNEMYSGDVEALRRWSTELTAKIDLPKRELEKLLERHDFEKYHLEDAVQEIARIKEQVKEYSLLKEDLHEKFRETIEGKHIRKCHAQKRLRLVNTWNQSNTLQLEMRDSQLKKVQQRNLANLSAKEEEKVKVGNLLQNSRDALDDARKRSGRLSQQLNIVGEELGKNRLALNVSTGKNQEKSLKLELLLEETGHEKSALDEITNLCRNERDTDEQISRSRQADQLRVQRSLKATADLVTHLQTQYSARQQRDEDLSRQNATLRENISEYDQTLAILELFNDDTQEKLDWISAQVEQKLKAKEDLSFLRPSQKSDLVLAENIVEDLQKEIRDKARNIQGLEAYANNWKASIKSKLDQKIHSLSRDFSRETAKRKEIEEEQMSKLTIIKELQMSERHLKDLFQPLTDTLAENCSYHEKLNQLVIANERDSFQITAKQKYLANKAGELTMLKAIRATLEEENQTLAATTEESERKTKNLQDKITEKKVSVETLREKIHSRSKLQSLLDEKKASLAKIIKDQDEIKIKIEEKRTELQKIISDIEQRQMILEDKKKILTEETERMEEKRSNVEQEKMTLKTTYEHVLFKLGKAGELLTELGKETLTLKMEKRSLANKLASNQCNTANAKEKEEKIKVLRLELDELTTQKFESMRERAEDINFITSKLNSIKLKIAHIEKRSNFEAIAIESSPLQKSILKQSERFIKKQVRFSEPIAFFCPPCPPPEDFDSQEDKSTSTEK